MWSRAELKFRGRTAFLRNFWLCVLVAVILSFAVGNSGSGSNHSANNEQQVYEDSGFHFGQNPAAIGTITDTMGSLHINIGPLGWVTSRIASGLGILIATIVVVGGLIFSVVILHPLEVGCSRFFLVNLDEKASLGELGYAFRNGWMNSSLILFVRDLKLMLWSLLLIIPGIVKSYEYRMIPYLLAENPNMSTEDAFAESKRMMYGNKMDAFVLDLSFIGWHIVGMLTVGLVETFWTEPYVQCTNAALYDTLCGGRFYREPYVDGWVHDTDER